MVLKVRPCYERVSTNKGDILLTEGVVYMGWVDMPTEHIIEGDNISRPC